MRVIRTPRADCLTAPYRGFRFLSVCLAVGYFRNVPPVGDSMPPNVPPDAPGCQYTSTDVSALLKRGFHRGKEKGRTLLEAYGLIYGARGRNRTGTPFGGGF